MKAWATDGVMTRLNYGCNWVGYLFLTTSYKDPACSLTVTLPPGTTVRTVLLSARENYPDHGIGLIISVGDTDADKLDVSKRCYFNNDPIKTSSTTGFSAWLTCDNLVGAKLFVTNPNHGRVVLFEIMAFTQYNVMPFVLSVTGAISTQPNTILKLKSTEMNIQNGTELTCYTSLKETTARLCTNSMNDPCYPYVWFIFEAVIPFSTFLAIPQIP